MKRPRNNRERRHLRVRKKIFGTAVLPRLNIFRSRKHIYAQIIDDDAGCTLAAASSVIKGFEGNGGNSQGAAAVGKLIADSAKAKGIEKVVFDRGGFPFHGRVKALAEAAREGGLAF